MTTLDKPYVKPLTIDKLILVCLAEGRPVTEKQLSMMWGEDKTRVREWLEKFTKMGLCSMRKTKSLNPAKVHDCFVGKVATIEKYLESQK